MDRLLIVVTLVAAHREFTNRDKHHRNPVFPRDLSRKLDCGWF
jgi:hypothetical protein